MHRSNGRRRPAARIIGWGLVAVAYVAVLVWATSLNADQLAASGEEAQAVAGAIAAVPAELNEELAAMAEIPTPAEAPLVTLGLAAAMIFTAAAWYVVHTFRRRHPRARSARLIVRHITTLM
ncbi:MAG TPA: hypothetical protein VF071_06120 [Candidatus Limnocylindria bacterium]